MTTTSKVYVVTGAQGNIGQPICKGLAQSGATVVMVVRDPAKAEDVRAALVEETRNPRIETLACDLSSLDSVRKAAKALLGRHPVIHGLINNAAAFSAERKTTKDGFELQLGVNHLAHFLLTLLLEPALFAAKDARVVVVGMPSGTPIRLDDLMLEKKYDGMTAYGMSKAANLAFTRELAERWKGKVAVNAVHPGMTKTTLINEAPLAIRLVFALFASRQEKGAETPLYVATAPELAGVTGKFFVRKKDTAYPKGANEDPRVWKQLWAQSEKLVGLSPARA
ncbi:MAG: SDR family NAD(P)-dependent oxidoreductase [Myxococcota bacterium]